MVLAREPAPIPLVPLVRTRIGAWSALNGSAGENPAVLLAPRSRWLRASWPAPTHQPLDFAFGRRLRALRHKRPSTICGASLRIQPQLLREWPVIGPFTGVGSRLRCMLAQASRCCPRGGRASSGTALVIAPDVLRRRRRKAYHDVLNELPTRRPWAGHPRHHSNRRGGSPRSGTVDRCVGHGLQPMHTGYRCGMRCRFRRRNRRAGACGLPIWAIGIVDARRSCQGLHTSRSH